ncbi:MAG TPA: hypothetical protein VGO50_19945 [Pyrinomonadaceae bacterium]|jgi:hypothetical protein|nr:hypothetical protein [Pyrinomonadaceae bacterium]
MKLVKIIIAGIVGGILIFVWSFVAHMALPFAHWGMQSFPVAGNEALQSVIYNNIQHEGLYAYPGVENMDQLMADPAANAAYEEKYKTGPSGILIVVQKGEGTITVNKLLRELGTDVAAAILGALIIFWGVDRSSLFRTFGMSIALGLMAWFLISASYNIWYRFPRDMIIGEAITEVAGFAIAGIGFYIVSLFFKRRKPATTDLSSGI